MSLQTQLKENLDAWLPSGAPIAVAYSGGGDSTAVLHTLRDMSPHVFIVDHALRPESHEEAKTAKAFAERLGLKADILIWQHDNPATGLQEKARKARYALLGQACRKMSIEYLITGHTEDDQAETLFMRYERRTDWRGAAGMRALSPSPIWPDLAGVTVLRPALDVTRQSLRDYNEDHGLRWSEDPSNRNTDFARIRARQYLARNPEMRRHLLDVQKDLAKGREDEARYLRERRVDVDENGLIRLSSRVPEQLLGYLLQAASGQGGPVKADKIKDLNMCIKESNFKAATLAGAMVIRDDEGMCIFRDPVAVQGRKNLPAIAPMSWPGGERRLWDGRFWIDTALENVTVKPLYGHQNRLTNKQRETLKSVPVRARPSLPLIGQGDDILAVGTAVFHRHVTVQTAVREHLNARLA